VAEETHKRRESIQGGVEQRFSARFRNTFSDAAQLPKTGDYINNPANETHD
jgi:hypothetical protein